MKISLLNKNTIIILVLGIIICLAYTASIIYHNLVVRDYSSEEHISQYLTPINPSFDTSTFNQINDLSSNILVQPSQLSN